MRTHLLTIVSLAAISLGAGCGAGEDGTGETDDQVVGSDCVTSRSGASLDDPFAALLEANNCPKTTSGVIDKLKSAKVFAISEEGDKASKSTGYRFVVTQPETKDDLFFSILGSPGNGVGQNFAEVMAFSKKKGGYNYYALEGGKWVLEGNGADAKVGEQAFRCIECHTTGAPVMKEQQDSWSNWNSTWFSMPKPESSDKAFNDMFAKLQRADDLEPLVASGINKHQDSRIDRELAAGNLKGLLQQVMCEVDAPTFTSSHSMNSNRFAEISSFPGTNGSIFVNQMFGRDGRQRNFKNAMTLGLDDISISIDGAAYKKALANAGMELKLSGGVAKDAMFPMFTPDRSFSDNVVIEQLIAKKILDDKLVADLLMTDFTNASYSKTRCDLAKAAPTSGKSPDDVRKGFITNLGKSSAEGAAELKARLEAKADLKTHKATVDTFIKACQARNQSDKDQFTVDVLKVVAQRRLASREHPAVAETADKILPKATKWQVKKDEFRLNPTTCALEQQ
jgi:hypothetical protein